MRDGHCCEGAAVLDEADWAVEVIEQPPGSRPLLLVCDHASARVPAGLNDLGLPSQELYRHIGWDIGAAAVTRRLAEILSVPAILSTVSRLVIDCNRRLGHPTSIPETSDGTWIPANQALTPAAIEQRAMRYFHPYHRAIEHHLESLERGGTPASIIAIHSFTPVMDGFVRPWEAGVLWNEDGRLALPLMQALRQHGLCVGDNEPYSGRTANYTVDTHGGDYGRLHVSIEIRQDLIADEVGAIRWAKLLGEVMPLILDSIEARA